jgi:hypothetical protein
MLIYDYLGSMHQFSCDAAQFSDAVFVLVRATQGGDTRGSEMASQTIVNSQSAPRGVYAMSGYLALVNTYTKTRHNTGFDKLVGRFPAKEVMRLLLYLIVLIRPVEACFIRELLGEKAAEVYRTHLWVSRDKPTKVDHFTDVLRLFTDRYMRVPLGISDWRHLMKTIFRNLFHINLEDNDDQEMEMERQGESSLLDMFGHNDKTVGQERYGLEYSHLGVDFDEVAFANWLRGAIRLHRFQGLSAPTTEMTEENSGSKLSQLMEQVQTLVGDVQQVQTVVRKEVRVAAEGTFLPALQEALGKAIETSFLPAIKEAITRNISSPSPVTTITTPSSTTHSQIESLQPVSNQPPSPPVTVHPHRLQVCLCVLFHV